MQKLKLKNDKSVGLDPWHLKVLRKHNKKWVYIGLMTFKNRRLMDKFLEETVESGVKDRRYYEYKATYDFRAAYKV